MPGVQSARATATRGRGTSAPWADSVIVVGAGPAGLASALALACQGVRSLLVDAGDGAPRPGSRSCGLDAWSLGFVEGLVGGRLPGADRPWEALRIRRRGRMLPALPDPSVLRFGIPQEVVEAALLAAVDAHPLVTTAWQHRVESVSQDSESVTVLARGPSGAVRWRVAWLVGCDGFRSPVRRSAGVRFPGRPRVDRLLCADVRVHSPTGRTDDAPLEPWLFADPSFHRGGMVLAQPLPGEVWRLSWQLPMAHGVARAGDATRVIPMRGDLGDPKRTANRVRAALRQLMPLLPYADPEVYAGGEAAPHGRDVKFDLLWSGEYEVHQRLAWRFRTGRVLLAGDAAHLVHPWVSDSVDLALQDARNLAWKLGWVLRGQAPTRLLSTYDSERRGMVRRRLALGEDSLHFLAPRGTAQKVGRQLTLLGARGRSTTLRRLDPHGPAALPAGPDYAGSPLSTSGPGVGDQACDVPVVRADGAKSWLSQCLDRGLVLMLVAPGIQVWEGARWREAGMMPTLRSRASALPVPAEVVVTHEYPEAEAHTLVLVRPDGYVAGWLPPERVDELEDLVERLRGASR